MTADSLYPKRLAVAGDWHANYRWAKKAIKYAAECGADHILHTGDYGYLFRRDYINEIEKQLKLFDLNLWFVDGNHECFPNLYCFKLDETTGRRPISDHVDHLPRGYRWEWNGQRYLAMGGAYSIDRKWRTLGKSWWSEETVTDEEIDQAIAAGPADVLLMHDAPSGVEIPGLASGAWRWPSDALIAAEQHREKIARLVDAVEPNTIFHGHYHLKYQAFRKSCLVTGLDCNDSTLPGNILIVDPEQTEWITTP